MNSIALTWGGSNKWLPIGGLCGSLLQIPKLGLFELDISATEDLTDTSTSCIFSLKTLAAADSGGDFTYAIAGFNTLSAFHDPAEGQVAIPFIIGNDTPAGRYVGSINLLSALGQITQLSSFAVDLQENFATASPLGTETTGSVTISGTNTSSVVTLSGMKADGLVLAIQSGTPASANWGGVTIPTVVNGVGQFTISVPVAPQVTPGDGKQFTIQYFVITKGI